MKMIDYIVIGIALLSIIIGIVFGASKRIRKSPSGIISFILTLITAFTVLTLVLNIPNVKEWLNSLTYKMLEADNWFLTFLVKIRIEIIILGIIITALIMLIKFKVCDLIADYLEMDNKLSSALNKTLGVVLSLVTSLVIFLVTLEIIYLINGNSGWGYETVNGSLLRIDYLYENNPIIGVYNYIKSSYSEIINAVGDAYGAF
ncbi:MAG: hypothetical protein IKP77_03125 [Acholeplasmatales bacterium]|nr:hypothetical protein [Acholeplasmatales bacterium]